MLVLFVKWRSVKRAPYEPPSLVPLGTFELVERQGNEFVVRPHTPSTGSTSALSTGYVR